MSDFLAAVFPVQSVQYAYPSTPPTPRYKLRLLLSRIAIIALLFDIALGSTLYGLRLRKNAFINTTEIHFLADVRNAFRWGNYAEDKGLFNVYDNAADDRLAGERTIDYTPFRLVAAYEWVQWAHRNYPGVDEWQNDYDFTRPMLTANTIAEFLSSILIFLLIRLWIVRMRKASPSPGIPGERRGEGASIFFLGVIPALFGALLFWFNPAVIWDSHCWPQWDVWLIPFFLAAVLLASIDWWFTAGICIMIGAALKGQMLLGAPILLLWPLCAAHFSSALKLTFGFLFAAALIVLPWMHLESPSIFWCIRIAVAAIALTPITLRPRFRRASHPLPRSTKSTAPARHDAIPPGRLILDYSSSEQSKPYFTWKSMAAGAILALLLAWPYASPVPFSTRCEALIPIAILIIARFFPANLKPQVYAAVLAGAVLLTIPLFNANNNWYTIGFKYGTEKFGDMITGSGAWNISKMQQTYFNSYDRPDDPFMIPGTQTTVYNPFTKTTATYRETTLAIYAVTLLLCSAGAAYHARRRRPDTRFLAAMATPWLCAFMLLPQMHGRYTIWAAGLAALFAGVNVGLALLGVLLSIIATLGIMENQYLFVRNYDPDTLHNLQQLDPHLGWAMLIIMAVFLYVSATPRSRIT